MNEKYKWISDCCLTSSFRPWREQVTFQWEDVHFVLDQHA